MCNDGWIKTNYDFELKIFDQKFCKALVGAPIRFSITQNRFKFLKKIMGLKLERSLELFLQENWSELSLILFLCFLNCSFTSDSQRTFIALQFATSNDTKISQNSVNEWHNYWEMFGDKERGFQLAAKIDWPDRQSKRKKRVAKYH
jgi:hypothetical protein